MTHFGRKGFYPEAETHDEKQTFDPQTRETDIKPGGASFGDG